MTTDTQQTDANGGGSEAATQSEADIWKELEQAERDGAASDQTVTAAPEKTGEPSQSESDDRQGAEPAKTEPGKGDGQGSKAEDGAAPAADQTKPDPWASAPPELREQYERVQREKDELARIRSGQDRKIRTQERELSRLRGGNGNPAGAGKGTEPKPNPKLERLKQDYPEIAETVEEVTKELRQEIEPLKGHVRSIAESKRDEVLDANEAALLEKHPDFETVTSTKEFAEWLDRQPRYVKEAAARNGNAIVDLDEALDLVGRYKQHAGIATPTQQPASASPKGGGGQQPSLPNKRERQLEGAAAPTRTSAPVVSGIPEDGDPAEIWKAFDRIERDQAR